ncbi:MAG: hypothetical protein KAK00_00300 [Nanoarchaeota archaeon]|nr:hypothetical protein [Nanoarchaeota archaeon]
MNENEKKQLEKIKEQADIILKKEESEKSYYEYNLWERNGKKIAYFNGFESGHGMDGCKIKELRRTGFYVDMVEGKIVAEGLYAKLFEIRNIEVVLNGQ